MNIPKCVPNIITIIRFFLVPIFIYTFYTSNNYILPFAIFIFAGFTDALDGFIARRFNLITKWGKMLDPLADKVLQISVLFALTDKGLIPLWIIIVVILKEICIIVGSGFVYSSKIDVYAKWYGKLATIMFYLAVLLAVFIDKQVGIYAFALAVTIGVFSVFGYAVDYMKVLQPDLGKALTNNKKFKLKE